MAEACVFCKIVEGSLPSNKVYEDDKFVALLDIRPLNPGHTLVIPKKHYKWVYDVEEFGEYWEVTKKVTSAILNALNPKFIEYLTFGLEVPHSHIHIIPRFDNDRLGGFPYTSTKKIPENEMKNIAGKIREKIE